MGVLGSISFQFVVSIVLLMLFENASSFLSSKILDISSRRYFCLNDVNNNNVIQESPSSFPKSYSLRSSEFLRDALLLHGPVSKGYGRGSKKLGVPTANLPHFDSQFASSVGDDLPNGVYFGWGRVTDGSTLGCVANIGKSPTFVGQENSIRIVEAHILTRSNNSLMNDFYDESLSLCLVMFLRPEKKFPNFQDLMTQINKDVEWSKELHRLAEEKWVKSNALEVGKEMVSEDETVLEKLLICRHIANEFLSSPRRNNGNLIFERVKI